MRKIKVIAPRDNSRTPFEIDHDELNGYAQLCANLGLLCRLVESQSKLYIDHVNMEVPATIPKESAPTEIKLPVVYYSQRDTKRGAIEASRRCFSSTAAMLLKFHKPGALSGSSNADDEYYDRLDKFGDTTDPQAHVKCLKYFGLKAEFRANLNHSDAERELKEGRPLGAGWLIWGSISNPSGGGHWSCIRGMRGSSYIVNDPYGEHDLVKGVYLSSNGEAQLYSKENFGRRWMAGPIGSYRYTPGTGWGLLVRP